MRTQPEPRRTHRTSTFGSTPSRVADFPIHPAPSRVHLYIYPSPRPPGCRTLLSIPTSTSLFSPAGERHGVERSSSLHPRVASVPRSSAHRCRHHRPKVFAPPRVRRRTVPFFDDDDDDVHRATSSHVWNGLSPLGVSPKKVLFSKTRFMTRRFRLSAPLQNLSFTTHDDGRRQASDADGQTRGRR